MNSKNQTLPNGEVFYCREKTMLQFLRKLFCFHAFDYESDIFAEVECRKCGKTKPE